MAKIWYINYMCLLTAVHIPPTVSAPEAHMWNTIKAVIMWFMFQT